ncbi:MAG: hypothetical protein K6F05_05220 [Succinivibrio sp.]|nr:hypothetical protein [Succinivibrio sp.]
MALKIALYGYDSDIGKLIIETLDEGGLEFADFFPLSPLTGEYDAVTIGKQNYFVQNVNEFDFAKADVAFFITTPDETQRLADKARQSGCIVIDNSHLYSGNNSIPVILPEVNGLDIQKAVETRLVVPATSLSSMLCLTLKPLQDAYGLSKVTATALLSVSEHGRVGTEALARETTLLLNGMAPEHYGFPEQLAFNLHTRVGEMLEDGYSERENITKNEVQKLLGGFERGFDVTCLLAPVFYGHTVVVNVELEDKATVQELCETFGDYPEYLSLKPNDELLTPVTHVINERNILVNRVRQVGKSGKSFTYVAMLDNTRRGEAISCVKIAKLFGEKL